MVFQGRSFPRSAPFFRKRQPIELIEMGGPIWGLFFRVFNGGSRYGDFSGSVGHCIRLWFAVAGVFVDCRFCDPWGIETIEMIEMIEMGGGAAGWGCACWRGSGGGRAGNILDFGPLDSGAGCGFSLWFGMFWKISNHCFFRRFYIFCS